MTMRLKEVYDRVEACKERYWKIPKETRIEDGLRPEVGAADGDNSSATAKLKLRGAEAPSMFAALVEKGIAYERAGDPAGANK